MPYTRIWIHLIWATKNRSSILNDSIRQKLFDHIKTNALQKGIHLDTIGGYVDHVHALLELRGDQSVAQVAQLLKGESSHWANQEHITPGHFEWQVDYAAFSISHSDIAEVRHYIRNQEGHHRIKTMDEEYQTLASRFGLPEEGIGQ